ncbi:LysR family transcriptional regulator [Pigmentiphaga soli]|uniref:LysR family transcriptional regulator n=1 Tax=Pigmentiphaga soli TaxID=1007095 RepID=A0ABP8GD75_9BURK
MTLDSLHAIAVFVRVAECGSFTEAAARLGMSTSGISKSLIRLESRLGCRLVNRTTRSLHLTDEGRALLGQFRQILDDVEQAQVVLSSSLAKPSGRLRLQAPVSFGQVVVMPLLTRLTNEMPELSVDVELNDRSADPAEEGLDAAIRLRPPSDSRLIARKLCDSRHVAVASPAYLKRHGEPATPDDLAGHHCMAYYVPQTDRYRPWQFTSAKGQTVVWNRSGRLNVNNGRALLLAAIDGAGIALVPDYIASDAVRGGKLRPVLRQYRVAGPSVWLLYGERRFQLPRVRALIEMLLAEVPRSIGELAAVFEAPAAPVAKARRRRA